MENAGRLYSQVAAEAGVSPEKAMVACYLSNLSKQGRTMDEAATLLRKERADVRDYARDWSIPFPDYMRSQPRVLTWRKAKVGWELRNEAGQLVARSRSRVEDGTRICEARGEDSAVDLSALGSSHDVAMRRFSARIDRRALAVLGVDDVAVFVERDGVREQVAPKTPEEPSRLRNALAAA